MMKSNQDRISILKRIGILMLAPGLILVLLSALIINNYQKEILHDRCNDLATITNLQVREISSWLENRTADGLFLTENPDFRRLLELQMADPDNNQIRTKIGTWIRPLLTNFDYCALRFHNSAGAMILSYSLDNNDINYQSHTTRSLIADPHIEKLAVGDIYFDQAVGHYHLDISVPVFNGSNRTGTLVLAVNPEQRLFPLILDWPFQSMTSEAILMKRNGDSVVYSNRFRFSSGESQTIWFNSPMEQLVFDMDSIVGLPGFFKGTDYRNEKVLIHKAEIPGTKWFLILKIDLNEVYTPFWKFVWLIGAMAFILIMAISAVIATILKRNEARVLRHQLETEKKTLALEKHYGYLTKYANDIIMLLNEKGELLQMNERGLEQYGYTFDEIKNMHISQLRAASVRGTLPETLDGVVKEGHIRIESIHVTKNGKEFPVEISARKIETGGTVYIQSIVRDITNRKNQERELRESEEKFRLLAESSPVAILIYQNDKWIYANSSAEKITGFSIEELFEKDFWQIVYPEDQHMIIERGKARQQGNDIPSRYQFRIIQKNGEVRWVDLSGTMIYFKNKPAGMVSVLDITEQKMAMFKIAENEFRFRSLHKAAPAGIGVVTNRILVEVNDKVCEMTGYSQEELLNKNAVILYPTQEEFDWVGTEKCRQIAESGIGELETRWITKEKQIVDILLRSVPIDPDDLSKGVIFTALDITNRKRSEDLVRENQRILSTLISNVPGIVYRCRNDQNWSMMFLSDGFKNITGFEPKDFMEGGSKSYGELIHPGDRSRVWETVQEFLTLEGFYELEFRLRTIKGDYRWVWERGRGIYDHSHKLLFLEGFITDIEERRHIEDIQKVVFNIANAMNYTENLKDFSSLIRSELARIIDTENFLIAIYDAVNNTLSLPFMADEKDDFQTFPAGKTLTGYVVANNLPMLVDENEIREMAAKGLIEYHGTPAKQWLGVPLKGKDFIIGALVLQSYTKSDAFSKQDLDIVRFVSTQVALSIERKRNEEELRVATKKAIEADKMKSAFLANMSHEIRTPMNAIIGFSDLLGDPEISNIERASYLSIIQNNGSVLLKLIDDILDSARLEAGQLKVEKQLTAVNTILDELHDHFNEYRHKIRRSQIQLVFPQYKGKQIQLRTDALRFRQIITNLINNALKFTETGYVEFGYLNDPPANAPAPLPEPCITFYVKDTGIGIPADKLDLVFDRFGQASVSHARVHGGKGLGLSIAKNLTVLLGGKIWLESNEGSGTVFYIALPAPAQEKHPLKKVSTPEDTSTSFDGKGFHFLVAEDDNTSAWFLMRFLEKTGATVTIVANGKQAVDYCLEGGRVDILFMDLYMPVMSGFDATQLIKEHLPSLPVIAQTAFNMTGELPSSSQMLFDSIITKPIRNEEIFAALKKAVEKIRNS